MPDTSYCEFNDAEAKIRGHILGADGVFAGSFSADTVVVQDKINVQDGAIGTYVFLNPATDMKLEHTIVVPADSVAENVRCRIVCGFRTEATEAAVIFTKNSTWQGFPQVSNANKYLFQLWISKNGSAYGVLPSIGMRPAIHNRWPGVVARDACDSLIDFIDPNFDKSIQNTYKLRADILIFTGWEPWNTAYRGVYAVDVATNGLMGPILSTAPRVVGFKGICLAEFLYR